MLFGRFFKFGVYEIVCFEGLLEVGMVDLDKMWWRESCGFGGDYCILLFLVVGFGEILNRDSIVFSEMLNMLEFIMILLFFFLLLNIVEVLVFDVFGLL